MYCNDAMSAWTGRALTLSTYALYASLAQCEVRAYTSLAVFFLSLFRHGQLNHSDRYRLCWHLQSSALETAEVLLEETAPT